MSPHPPRAASAKQAVAGITSMATGRALTALANQYAGPRGITVVIESVGGVDAARRVAAGEPFDLVVLAADAIDALAREHHVDATSRVTICESAVAVAVAPGNPLPRLKTPDDVRRLVEEAPRIAYSTGPSGRFLKSLLEQWGIADAIANRLVLAPPGVGVGTLLARGDADVGFQQASELVHVKGIGFAGELPAAIQQRTAYCGALCATGGNRANARDALAWFASPDAAATLRSHGLIPVAGS